MEIVLAAVVAAAVAGIVVAAGNRRGPAAAAVGHAPPPESAREEGPDATLTKATAAPITPGTQPSRAPATGRPRSAADDEELRARRGEIARIEERLLSKEEALGVRLSELERKERSFEDR